MGSKAKGALVAVVVSAFTFWKTVIYLWYVHPYLTPEAKVINIDSLMYFIIPSSFWIICPFLTMVGVSGRICRELVGKVKKIWWFAFNPLCWCCYDSSFDGMDILRYLSMEPQVQHSQIQLNHQQWSNIQSPQLQCDNNHPVTYLCSNTRCQSSPFMCDGCRACIKNHPGCDKGKLQDITDLMQQRSRSVGEIVSKMDEIERRLQEEFRQRR